MRDAFVRENLVRKKHSIGIGYRFQNAGRWSKPEETLEKERIQPPGDGQPLAHEFETQLQDHTGAACAAR